MNLPTPKMILKNQLTEIEAKIAERKTKIKDKEIVIFALRSEIQSIEVVRDEYLGAIEVVNDLV